MCNKCFQKKEIDEYVDIIEKVEAEQRYYKKEVRRCFITKGKFIGLCIIIIVFSILFWLLIYNLYIKIF